MNTESLCLVGAGEHYAATNGDRLALQRRIQHLLNRRIEGVEIGMEDGRGGFHQRKSQKWNKKRTLLAVASQASQSINNNKHSWAPAGPGGRWSARRVAPRPPRSGGALNRRHHAPSYRLGASGRRPYRPPFDEHRTRG